MRRIVIIGGGFSGSSAAVQLVRRSPVALDITIVEPRARVGGGLAYSTDEPEHRLNGQPGMHSLDPAAPAMFARWCDARDACAADPASRIANGTAFMRRSLFRAFLEQTVTGHAAWPTGSSIRHVMDRAIDVVPGERTMTVVTAGGARLESEVAVLAPGHTRARLPAPFAADHARHARVIADPLAAARLPAVPADDRVLVLGSGLTAYDIVSTLLAAGHRGAIDVVSRRGLRPRPQRPPPVPGLAPLPPMLERVAATPEAFILGAGDPPKLRSLLRALRRRIAAAAAAGESWDGPFDHLRDMAGQVWPKLSSTEKRRFFRQLRPWYDVHRFRVAPQNAALVEHAERSGQVRFRAAGVVRVESGDDDAVIRIGLRARGGAHVDEATFDRVINCTGVDAAPPGGVPLYAALLRRGLACLDPSGVGLAVDAHCRMLGADGHASARLRLIGPPTLGARGDPLGSAFIAIRIHHMLPDVLDALGALGMGA